MFAKNLLELDINTQEELYKRILDSLNLQNKPHVPHIGHPMRHCILKHVLINEIEKFLWIRQD